MSGTVTILKSKNAVAIKVKPLDDQDVEGDETISLKLIPNSEYTHSLSASATITLKDNEKAQKPPQPPLPL